MGSAVQAGPNYYGRKIVVRKAKRKLEITKPFNEYLQEITNAQERFDCCSTESRRAY